LKKVFELLDVDQNLTVTKSELRGAITTFLLPLTREQFQDVLAQVQCMVTDHLAQPILEAPEQVLGA
jgi:hypothetical protein